MTRPSLTRREFLRTTSFAAAAVWFGVREAGARSRSANDRLSLGIIGTANRAASNISGVASQNIVALCDIDDRYLASADERFPGAKRYSDFRELLDQKDIDAVVVSTADHTHAVITAAALASGRHAYCEKPLAHTVSEARTVAQLAAKYKRATQMGTQIHAGGNYRRVVELVRSGAIGNVKECHAWCEKSWSAGERPADTPPVPGYLHWDLWLGPIAARPYHPTYLPREWRRWWDFGNGTIGDMGCHYLDLVHWALDLRRPLTIEADGPPMHPETAPAWLVVRYEYPRPNFSDPLVVTWYDGGKRPALVCEGKAPGWRNGVLFVGEKGMLMADYDRRQLLPESQFAGFIAPAPSIPDSIGQYREWFEACKHSTPTTCNFDYSGALSEAVLLGNVAYRAGRKLEWDGEALKMMNCAGAMKFVQHSYRQGWKLTC